MPRYNINVTVEGELQLEIEAKNVKQARAIAKKTAERAVLAKETWNDDKIMDATETIEYEVEE